MAQNSAYSQPLASADSQPQMENAIFDSQLFESTDAKPTWT